MYSGPGATTRVVGSNVCMYSTDHGASIYRRAFIAADMGVSESQHEMIPLMESGAHKKATDYVSEVESMDVP